MKEPKSYIGLLTFLLASVAGYCDTVTFVSGKSIFSAHVTGNFIVFAAQAISENHTSSWLQLTTFPVFVTAVMAGGWLSGQVFNRYILLLVESVLLLLAAFATCILPTWYNLNSVNGIYLIVMIVVFALGLQNAFGKLYSQETHGPTTMMTGNVTQVALDLWNLFRSGFTIEASLKESIQKQFFTIGGFLLGCLLGALLANLIALKALFLPSLALLICSAFLLSTTKNNI
ncbi:YoaK family protein [Arcicella aquatica]|uniref:YoaK family protein n=1 Tax=Arcicella aquatica TaxID=217141 RepID=A0ABU5QNW1_9BACT|nr:YoaK family protein [Arcicella aquatica]MEA5258349.1 YoaK family protein [Arcicella aquatica]